MGKTKILLVDDHEVVRAGIKMLLKEHELFEVIAEAENGKQAIEIIQSNEVDIAVMDINMPVMDGLEATQEIIPKYPEVKILALTMLNEEQHIRQMLKAGASGYILKNSGMQELIKALTNISQGRHYFSPEATHIVMMDMVNEKAKISTKTESVYLTDREKDILKLIAQEFTNQEIGEKLFISVRTVDAHRRNLLQKIGARNAAGLAIYAMNHGILEE